MQINHVVQIVYFWLPETRETPKLNNMDEQSYGKWYYHGKIGWLKAISVLYDIPNISYFELINITVKNLCLNFWLLVIQRPANLVCCPGWYWIRNFQHHFSVFGFDDNFQILERYFQHRIYFNNWSWLQSQNC